MRKCIFILLVILAVSYRLEAKKQEVVMPSGKEIYIPKDLQGSSSSGKKVLEMICLILLNWKGMI